MFTEKKQFPNDANYRIITTGISKYQKLNYTGPRYNALQYNADSVITWLRSWTLTFQGLAKAAYPDAKDPVGEGRQAAA